MAASRTTESSKQRVLWVAGTAIAMLAAAIWILLVPRTDDKLPANFQKSRVLSPLQEMGIRADCSVVAGKDLIFRAIRIEAVPSSATIKPE
jgi:hypothetical protein